MEPASWLQNKARKTNTGLKLDFPKHCIPSHFTHHCGLQTRIEKPVKSASDSEWCSHWNIGQTSVLWIYLMRSESLNLFTCCMLCKLLMWICYHLIFHILKNFSPLLSLFNSSCLHSSLLPSHELPLLLYSHPSNCLSLR